MSDTSVRSRAAVAACVLLLLPGCAFPGAGVSLGRGLAGGGAREDALAAELARAETDASLAAAPADSAEALRARLAGCSSTGSPCALDRSALVAEVLRRNPSVAAARWAWRAALARYPQETALPDPLVAYSIAPRTIDSRRVPQQVYRIDVSQALPFPGKLGLRGSVALAEAEAAAGDYAAVRLRLAGMTSALFDEDWLLAQQAAINAAHLDLVREQRAVAEARYASGTAEQQDPLTAELEEAMLLHRAVEIEASQRITAQQIAALLHLPDAPDLPPPPASLVPVEAPLDADAAPERPELQAADARIAARKAGQDLARLAYLPDFRLMGVYDRSWDQTDMRPMVGLEVEVPLQLGRRRAAVEEADAEAHRAESERARLRDEIDTEVRTARERLAAESHGLAIMRDRVLPAARDRLAAARAGFEAGRASFADWIAAERSLRDAELGEREALARTSQGAADLLTALGVAPGLAGPPAAARPSPSAPAAPDPPGGDRHD